MTGLSLIWFLDEEVATWSGSLIFGYWVLLLHVPSTALLAHFLAQVLAVACHFP